MGGLLRYLGKQTLRLVALLFFVSMVTYTLVELSPLDPITAYLNAADVVSAAQRQEIAAYFGTDRGLVEGYLAWIGNLLQLDLGISIIYRIPVMEVIGEKFVSSLALMLTSFVLSGVLGLGLGIAMGQSKRGDALLKPLCLTLSATPTFFLGILFLIVFAVQLDWFPVAFRVPVGVLSDQVSWWQWGQHMVLPVLTLSVASCPSIALHTREKVLEVMETDYVLLAKSRGFTKRQIITRHLLRNIMLPFITLQFASLSEIFGGSILAEAVFSYPGLGSVMVDAGLKGDVALLLGVTMFSCVFVFVGNLTANVLYGCIDPKIRWGGRP